MPRIKMIELYNEIYNSSSIFGRPLRCHKIFMNRFAELKCRGIQSVFEISCGRGYVYRDLLFHGFDTWASEPCQYLIKHDLSKYPVFPYMIHEFNLMPSGKYDLVFSINVADHMANEDDVSLVLAESIRMAKKGVCLIVNGDSTFQTVHEPIRFWADKIKKETGHSSEIHCIEDTASGGDIIFVWFSANGSKVDADITCNAA